MVGLRFIVLSLILQYFFPESESTTNDQLYSAVVMSDIDSVQQLLSRPSDILSNNRPVTVDNPNSYNRTSLLSCGFDPQYETKEIDEKCYQIAELLIFHGANYNWRDNDGWNGVAHSAVRGLTKYMSVFLQRGINVDSTDNVGRTAMMKAAFHARHDVVQALLSNAANPCAQDIHGKLAIVKGKVTGTDILLRMVGIAFCSSTND